MLISVIVPIYNVEPYLSRCVDSIIHQTYQNLEIILVDDGSTDKCPIFCEEWAKKDERIKVIHKKNGGLSDARNVGLSVASGDYIGFIDSDDWVEINFYEYLLRALLENECEVVGCAYKKCMDEEISEDVLTNFSVKIYETVDAVSALIDNKIQQVVWNKLYRRDAIEGILFDKGKYHEDEFWMYRVLGHIRRYAEITYVGYNYFQWTGSVMGQGYSLKRLDSIEAKQRRYEYLKDVFPELSGKGSMDVFVSCIYQGQQALRFLAGRKRNEAITILKQTAKRFRTDRSEWKKQSFKQRFWLYLARVAFVTTCHIRNILSIGI